MRDDTTETLDLSIDLADAMERLSPRQEQVIRHLLSGYSLSEIAALCCVTPPTVHECITCACAKLRVALE
jgi:RNA polymerase sigma factor (sigma-70 family)